MKSIRRLSPLLLPVLLLSCLPKIDVRLASAAERLPNPGFIVEHPEKPDERPRYDTVQAFDDQQKLIWHLRAEPFGDQNSVRNLVYRTAPTGFAVVVEPEMLVAGKTYTIVISGTGRGQLRFKAGSDGMVTTTE